MIVKLLFETQIGEWVLAMIEYLFRIALVPVEDL